MGIKSIVGPMVHTSTEKLKALPGNLIAEFLCARRNMKGKTKSRVSCANLSSSWG
jgi:hypothetical protein